MSAMVWQTVWEIAGRRNNTKQGEGHLSSHGFTVLQTFVAAEAQQTMNSQIGNVMILRVE